jgi:hypothetical protein
MKKYKLVKSNMTLEIDLIILCFDVFDMRGCIFM